LAIDNVTVAGDGDVVVAWVVQARIPFGIDGDPDDAVATTEGVEILRWIEVIVNVNQVCQLART
jgi:hypothetical protein